MTTTNDARHMQKFAREMRMQCVYVIEADNGRCKIGKSTNVGNRANSLAIGSPQATRVYYAICLKYSHAHILEKLAHKALKKMGLHARGEWFYLSGEAASRLIENLADRAKFPWAPDLIYGFGRST